MAHFLEKVAKTVAEQESGEIPVLKLNLKV
jgi:hypothetical protein